MEDKIEKIISALMNAKSVVVFTGAGMSKESGVPTFRDADGLWMKFKPEELANFNAFMNNPDLVTEWYSHRRKIISEVKPNPGHFAVAELEKLFLDFCVITQNVDNLHRRAGSGKVYELHGNIERNYCVRCRKEADLENIFPDKAIKCACGGLIRPDVVWFGEMLPEMEWDHAYRATERSDVFFSIGTSTLVYPAAELPFLAKRKGAFVVEINTARTEFSSTADISITGESGKILPEIVAGFENKL